MTAPDLAALPAIPRDDDGPVFRAPWEAQAFGMAVALHERGEIGAAIDAYDRALVLDPDFAEARRNRAMTLLLAGRMAEGWEDAPPQAR